MINHAAVSRALLHPLAMRILEYADEAEEPFSPNELSERFGEPLGNVSYHIAKLAGKSAGSKFQATPLLELVRTEPRRGAVEHYYRPVPVTKEEVVS